MSNGFYNHTSYPSTGASATSAGMRGELDSVAAGFDKLPTLTASYIVRVNVSGTALESVTAAGAGLLATSAIGTTVQAYDADLTTWAGVTPGTGIATALAVNVGTAGSPVINGGALGTPSGGTLTSCTGLPAAGVTGTALVSAAIGATVQGYDANTAKTNATQAFTKAQIGTPVALSVSSNLIAVDLSLGNNFTLTLQATTAQTLSNPTNVVAGQKGAIYITQNGTPSTLAFASYWIQATTGTAPAVSTTASARNILTYDVFDSTHIYYTLATAGVA